MIADIPWWVIILIVACGWLAYDIYASTVKIIKIIQAEFNEEE